jgi:hypothetical protein
VLPLRLSPLFTSFKIFPHYVNLGISLATVLVWDLVIFSGLGLAIYRAIAQWDDSYWNFTYAVVAVLYYYLISFVFGKLKGWY